MPRSRSFVPLDQARPPFFVGVDLGGTNIKVGLVDDLGQTLAFRTLATEIGRGPEDGARRMGQAVADVIDDSRVSRQDVARVGLGTPGTMDIPTGMLVNPINLPGWQDFPIRDRVSHHSGFASSYANDACAAAYGEFWVGSGREFHSMVMFTLGTGIGGGIIIGDLSVDGEHSAGAECGHIIIDYHDDARLCACGHTGHLEAYASATALIERTNEALAAGHKSSIAARLERGQALTPILVGEEADGGDALALELILDTARYLGIAAVSLINVIDPNGVVLGGAMNFGGHDTPLGRRFLARVREEVQRRSFPVPAAKTVVDFAALGGDAGYIGAAGIARIEHRRLQTS